MTEGFEIEQYKNHLIMQILNSTCIDGIEIFIENMDLLKDVSFIIPNPYCEGNNYIEPFQSLKLRDIEVNYFFNNKFLYCYNVNSIINLLCNKEDNLHVLCDVSFDTQVQSYLYRKYNGQTNTIPNSIQEVIKLIKERKWTVNGFAYLYENALFDKNAINSELFKENMYAFETYFYEEQQALQHAKQLAELDKKFLNDEFSDWYRRQYKLYYLELLMMGYIQLNYKGTPVVYKEEEYIKFFHDNVGILSGREANLAKLFFTHGTKIAFFGKIQKGNKNIIASLKNMAWDIFHIQNVLNNINMQFSENIDFIIPYFVTYDKRLKDILPVYQVKAIAFVRNEAKKWPLFETDLIDPIIHAKYFTSHAYIKRQEKLFEKKEEDIIKILDLLIDEYENKITSLV